MAAAKGKRRHRIGLASAVLRTPCVTNFPSLLRLLGHLYCSGMGGPAPNQLGSILLRLLLREQLLFGDRSAASHGDGAHMVAGCRGTILSALAVAIPKIQGRPAAAGAYSGGSYRHDLDLSGCAVPVLLPRAILAVLCVRLPCGSSGGRLPYSAACQAAGRATIHL